jgi:hypothetical protein
LAIWLNARANTAEFCCLFCGCRYVANGPI